jgi:O-antigen ligase
MNTLALPAPAAAVALPFPQRPGLIRPPEPMSKSQSVAASTLSSFGFVLICTFLLSGLANDLMLRLGTKAYLSTVTVVLLPAVWLICGSTLRGLQQPVGWWWVAFLLLLLAGLPFSVWRTGSLAVLMNWVPRSYMLFFYITAFALSVSRVRNLMYVNIVGAVIVLFTCVKFGSADTVTSDGRFRIPDSIFFSNSNDLALQLVLSMSQFVFLLYVPGVWKKVLGFAGFLLSFVYMLKTGSRGCLLASVALAIAIFVFSNSKVKLLLVALPILLVGSLTISSSALSRLALILVPDDRAIPRTADEASALASKRQREELFTKSLAYTLTHPLFGVGAGQFPVAVAGDAAKKGENSGWLGTHNSYTQISAECGMPALICYLAVLGYCFRASRRLYKQAAGKPEHRELAGLSMSLFGGTLVFAIGTFFFHMAYSGAFPILSAMILSLELAAKPQFDAEREAESAARIAQIQPRT